MPVKERFIEVNFEVEGLHYWPEAPSEVFFLADPHRHIFHFHVTMQVKHNDREVEFILLKRKLREYVLKMSTGWEGNRSFSTLSCEDLAERVLNYLEIEYRSKRKINVFVLEDDENGGGVSNYST